MTEIKVIELKEDIKNFHKFTPDDLDSFIDRLSLINIDKYHLDNFKFMIQSFINFKDLLNRPNIKELLLRKIILIGQTFFRKKSSHLADSFVLIPIITNDKKDLNSIRVHFDIPIFCNVILKNVYFNFVSAVGQEIMVVGLQIKPFCPKDSDYYLSDEFNIGLFNHDSLAKSCSFLPDLPAPSNLSGKSIFFFKDDPNIIDNLFDFFIKYIKYFYSSENQLKINSTLSLKSQKLLVSIGKKILPIYGLVPSLIDPKLMRFIKLIDDLLKININPKESYYKSNLLHTLHSANLFNIYFIFLILGSDNEILNAIQNYRESLLRSDAIKANLRKKINALNLLISYKSIIEDKFGIQKLKEIEKSITKVGLYKTVLTSSSLINALPDKEKQMVINIYEKKLKYIEEIAKNNCPHVKLYRKFRSAKFIGNISNIYSDLKKFFKVNTIVKAGNPHSDRRTLVTKAEGTSAVTNSFIKCNNCGFDLICPHFADYTELQLGSPNLSFNDFKNKLFMYIDQIPYLGNYYCFICGEVIANAEIFETDKVTIDEFSLRSSIDDELRKQMWGEMLGTIRNFNFNPVVDSSKIHNDMVNVCYDYIADIEQQLIKSKTNTSEDIHNKKKLFITIYAYAYMVNFVINNKNIDVSLKFSKKLLDSSKLIDLLKHILFAIINTKNILINKISGITSEFIKNKLIDAYKLVSGKISIIPTHITTYDSYNDILIDPIYKYIFFITHLGKAYKKSDEVSQLEKILNINLKKDLLSYNDIYDHIVAPHLSSVVAFDSIPNFEYGKSIDLDKIIKSYKAKSFHHFYDKIKLSLPFTFIYDDSGNFSDPFLKYSKSSSDILFHESQLNLFLHTFQTFSSGLSYVDYSFKYVPISLGLLFDENGQKHLWNIFIFNSLELTKIDLINQSNTTDLKYPFDDIRCSVCGILRSDSNKLSSDKLIQSLKFREDIENFFNFYENRCSEGGLHTFVNDNPSTNPSTICSKCKFSLKFLKNIYSPDAKLFYDEYKEKYLIEKKEAREIEIKILKKEIKPSLKTHFSDQFNKWNFNYNSVLELSKLLKLNNYALVNLASIEKINYDDVLSGSYIPLEIDNVNNPRIFKLDSYLQKLIFEYNRLRTYGLMGKPPDYLTSIINEGEIRPHEYSSLNNWLPIIYDDITPKILWFKQNKKPKEVVEFIIQYIIDLCLEIYNAEQKETKKLRESFVRYIINHILQLDKNTTLHKQFNFNIFVKKGEQFKQFNVYDPNYDDESGIERSDDLKSDELGDTVKPFKNHFDIDIVDDKEFEENELGDNDIDAGDNYGLS